MLLKNIHTPRDLAARLGIKYRDQLLYHLYKQPINSRYTTFQIPKRSGGLREIAAPHKGLKLIQRGVAEILEAEYRPKTNVYGFIRGRSIVQNAAKHKGAKYVLNLDLEDFFRSIHFGRIFGMLMAEPYNAQRDVAKVIAHLSCYDSALAAGAPTSPVLSNMIAKPLDNELIRLCRGYGLKYSRYADDITISSSRNSFPTAIAFIDNIDGNRVSLIGDRLNESITRNGFRINSTKTRLQEKPSRQVVTGLVVNEKVNVDRRFIRKVRAMLYSWENEGYSAAAKKHFKNRTYDASLEAYAANNFNWVVRGKIEFIRSVRGSEFSSFRTLASKFNELTQDTKIKVPELLSTEQKMASVCWVVRATYTPDPSGHAMCSESTVFFTECGNAITSAHGVSKHPEYGDVTKIQVFDPRNISFPFDVSIERLSEDLDVATLDISSVFVSTNKLPIKAVSQGTDLNLGKQIYVAGFPGYFDGNTASVRSGKIVETEECVGCSGEKFNKYVVDAQIIRGNSGGPIFDESCNIIGVAIEGPNDDSPNQKSKFVSTETFKEALGL